MNPEEQLRRLRDDERWEPRPFRLRATPRRSPVRPLAAVAALAVVVVAAVLAVGLLVQRPTVAPPAAAPSAVPSVVPWIPDRPATGPLTPAHPAVVDGTLRVALDVPRTASAGHTLDYRVTLTNPTSRTVPLRPCPVYRQSVGATGAVPAPSAHVLNCAPVPALAPGASAVFAMRVPVPTGLGGVVHVRWTLTGGASAVATTTVR